jgi:Ca-activated chloride channel family protein
MLKKKGSHFYIYLACAFLCGVSSCTRLSGQLKIIEGNFSASLGMYNEAAAAYMEAAGNAEAAPYAEFGLSSVYILLDENNLALQRLDLAEAGIDGIGRSHRELVYRIHYNRGVVLYREGAYSAAAAAFRKALETDGARTEAKRNLELSLLARGTPASAPAVKAMVSAGSEVLYDYMRRREREQWRSQQWTEESSEGLDY